MKLLLDTCTFLWLATDAPELSGTARELFENPANDTFLSSVSSWEIAVKNSLGALPLPEPPEIFVPQTREQMGIESLALEEEATLYLARLPKVHRDPFDRMLICQALCHGMALLTPDSHILQYPVRTVW